MPNARAASDPVRDDLGYTVCRLRQLRGWDQKTLAKAAGLVQTTVSGIERASPDVGLPAILKVAKALGVEVSVLFTRPRLPLGERDLRIDKRG